MGALPWLDSLRFPPLPLLAQQGLQFLVGFPGVPGIHGIIAMEHRRRLVAGKLHDDRMVHARPAQVRVKGVAQVMEPKPPACSTAAVTSGRARSLRSKRIRMYSLVPQEPSGVSATAGGSLCKPPAAATSGSAWPGRRRQALSIRPADSGGDPGPLPPAVAVNSCDQSC